MIRNRFCWHLQHPEQYHLPPFYWDLYLNTTGIWLCFVCGEGAAWLFICVYVWIHNRRVSIAVKDWALLPQSFGVPAETASNIASPV